jgi:hypothetical protein
MAHGQAEKACPWAQNDFLAQDRKIRENRSHSSMRAMWWSSPEKGCFLLTQQALLP